MIKKLSNYPPMMLYIISVLFMVICFVFPIIPYIQAGISNPIDRAWGFAPMFWVLHFFIFSIFYLPDADSKEFKAYHLFTFTFSVCLTLYMAFYA